MTSNTRSHLSKEIPPRRDTKTIGQLSEIMVIAALSRAGYCCSIPLGENARYDLIAEKEGKLLRVQVKTGRLRRGAILFNCYSVHANRQERLRTYRGSIDLFGVYCPDTSGAYLVPVDEVPRGCYGSIRVKPPQNGQRSRIRWAQSYLIATLSAPKLVVGGEFVNGVDR